MAEEMPTAHVHNLLKTVLILVANKIYNYFWSLVFWQTVKIRRTIDHNYWEHRLL